MVYLPRPLLPLLAVTVSAQGQGEDAPDLSGLDLLVSGLADIAGNCFSIIAPCANAIDGITVQELFPLTRPNPRPEDLPEEDIQLKLVLCTYDNAKLTKDSTGASCWEAMGTTEARPFGDACRAEVAYCEDRDGAEAVLECTYYRAQDINNQMCSEVAVQYLPQGFEQDMCPARQACKERVSRGGFELLGASFTLDCDAVEWSLMEEKECPDVQPCPQVQCPQVQCPDCPEVQPCPGGDGSDGSDGGYCGQPLGPRKFGEVSRSTEDSSCACRDVCEASDNGSIVAWTYSYQDGTCKCLSGSRMFFMKTNRSKLERSGYVNYDPFKNY